MKVIVGLGNPGTKYQLTRHNIGFLLIDALASVAGSRAFKSEFKAETARLTLAGESVLAVKPQTFMNLSGESVQPLLKFFNVEVADLLVVHDEVDLPFGHLRFQSKRGHGGHNGIRNIHQLLNTNDYARLRLGVGRPQMIVNDAGEKIRPAQEVHEYVLSNFSREEQTKMPEVLNLAIEGIEAWLTKGLAHASTLFNNKSVGG